MSVRPSIGSFSPARSLLPVSFHRGGPRNAKPNVGKERITVSSVFWPLGTLSIYLLSSSPVEVEATTIASS